MTAPPSSSLKYLSLCVLCLQNSLLAILMRLSRVGDFPKFNASTAVFMCEVLKFVVSVALILYMPSSHEAQDKKNKRSLRRTFETIFDQYEMLRVSVPALLYIIQNNLQYISASNLDAATFQVLYQLKILTTAMFSVVMLRKAILPLQWGAIVLLMIGVALVQLDDSNGNAKPAAGGVPRPGHGEQNMTIGLLAVIAACVCSGFAGVYFEKILKNSGSKATLWERNVQMGFISLVLGAIGLWINDSEFIATHGFFYGYRSITWAAISMNAFGGLLTAVVVKYADNILKAFATSIAIILSVIMSIFLFDKIPTLQFIIGAFIVNTSVYIYGTAPAWAASNPKSVSVPAGILPQAIAMKKFAP
ncbi:hypothetical protein Poli38472_011093 [Pythium oligandrum]|uniref:UDP-galactose transporter n=1 Tax=Pythium oligandrum TaxID=41045 RepID=A0A8K1CR59_PYTOL|nr:hypothetical protein Poli38472_011093 [Pythium oligandrum]|eukprot:TMW67473.1 hypothetical protein Poli38472_011093 [Pythium oligandrum]